MFWRLANSNAVSTLSFKGGIDIRHSFSGPQRPEQIIVSQQQMRVFVEDAVERICAKFGKMETDQIFVAAPMEECREISGFSLIERKKWSTGLCGGKRKW